MTRAFKVNISAPSIIKDGGTSSQFLKANGSIDSSTYLTSTTGVTTVNGSSGAITNVAKTDTANTFSTSPQQINAATSAIGLIIKANATTPGNLQEWQNSAGTVLGAINSIGSLYAVDRVTSYNGVSAYNASSFGDPNALAPFTYGSIVNISTLYATSPGLVIRGVASQSADLQQWRNSAGTVLASIEASGIATATAFRTNSGNSNQFGNGAVISGVVTAFGPGGNAAIVPVVIKGAASQTADLQQWQNSSGTVLASFDNNGRYNLNATYGSSFYGRLNVAGSSSDAYALDVGTINGNTPGVAQRISLNNNSDVGLIIQGYGSYQHTGDLFRIDGTRGAGGGDYFRVNANGAVQAYSATQKGLTVKGFASQTANLQEWQNSSGTAVALIGPTGGFYNPQGGDTRLYNLGIGGSSSGISWLYVTPQNASEKLVVLRGAASQTADLQQWQNSAGTVLASVDSAGNFGINITPTAKLHVSTTSTTAYGLISNTPLVGLTTGNTVNMAYFSDGRGATQDGLRILGLRDSTGSGSGDWATTSFHIQRNVDGGGYQADIGFGPGIMTFAINAAERMRITDTGLIIINSTSSTLGSGSAASQLGIVAGAATTVGVVVRGAASQTANLQEWQNSAGTVLASVGSAGNLTAPSIIPSGSTAPANGIYLPAANTLGFATNSTIALRITSTGTIGIAGTPNTGATFDIQKNITGATTAQSLLTQGTIQSDVTSSARYYETYAQTASANFTLTTLNHFLVGGVSTFANVTAGGAITNQIAFNVGSTTTGATNNYGFYGNIASGTNRWNFYANGTAANYFAGQTTVGSTSLTLGSGSVAQQFGVVSSAATTVGAVIRGAASQTANLQEWQDSAGTVLVSVASNGLTKWTGAAGLYSQIDQSGNLYIRTSGSYYSANLSLKTDAAGTKGIVVRGSASQTANLQEWQDSAGTALTWVASSGQLSTPTLSSQYFTNRANTGAYFDSEVVSNTLSLIQRTTTAVGIIVKGAASQTANLQEWHTSAGTVLASVASGGALQVNANATATGTIKSTQAGSGQAAFYTEPGHANVNGMILNGFTAQTADLFLTKNSAGTTLSGINAAGQIYAGTTASVVGSTTTAITSAAYTSATVAVFTYGGTSLVQAGQRVTVAGVTGGTYNGTFTVSAVTATTFTVLGSGFTNVAGSGGTFQLSAVGSFVSGTTAVTGLVVQAIASQVANMQEWLSSTGSVLMSVSSGGTISSAGSIGATSNLYSAYGKIAANTQSTFLGQISAIATSAATIGAVIRGAASQTANLQEWQNSAGSVLARVDQGGVIVSTSYIDAPSFANGGTFVLRFNGTLANFGTGTATGSQLTVTNATAANVGLIVKGAASQTANLQEWQDSNGSILASISATGDLTINGTTTTLNTNTLVVDDKNIEMGSIAAIASVTGTISAVTTTTTITGLSSTSGFIPGMALTKISGTGVFGGVTTVTSVDSATQLTITSTTANTIGSITFSATGATDITASGGGITLKGTADKTILWQSTATTGNTANTGYWNLTDNLSLNGSTKAFYINGTSVLSSSALGTGITSSSLTSVGTLANLTVTNPISGSVTGNAGTVTNGIYTTTTSLPNVTSVNSTTIPASATLVVSGANSNITSLTGLTTALSIAQGGTGAITAMTAATALLPSQTSNSGKYLTTDGAGTLSWGTGSSYSAPTIGSTSIGSGATVTTITGLTLTSPTITTPIIDSISASAATGINPSLYANTTTGNISIGAGLTSGQMNIATGGSSATPISIGHTNATIGLTGNTTVTGTLTSTSTIQGTTGTFTGATLAINGATPAITSTNASAASIFTSNVTSVTIGSSTIKTTDYPVAPTGTTSGTVTQAAQLSGYIGMPQNLQATSGTFTYTFAASDAGKHIYATGTPTSVTFTIPANSAVAFEIGTTFVVMNDLGAATNISIAITTDTMQLAGTGTTGTRTLARYGVASITKVTATKWIISGNGLT